MLFWNNRLVSKMRLHSRETKTVMSCLSQQRTLRTVPKYIFAFPCVCVRVQSLVTMTMVRHTYEHTHSHLGSASLSNMLCILRNGCYTLATSHFVRALVAQCTAQTIVVDDLIFVRLPIEANARNSFKHLKTQQPPTTTNGVVCC